MNASENISDDDRLTTGELARRLNCSPSVITNWRRRTAAGRPDFPAPVGGTEARPVFRWADVVEWLLETDRQDLVEQASAVGESNAIERLLVESVSPMERGVTLTWLMDPTGPTPPQMSREAAEQARLTLNGMQPSERSELVDQWLNPARRRSGVTSRRGSEELEDVVRGFVPHDATRVVDLTVGEGDMLLTALRTAPSATATALDIDSGVLQIAEARVRAAGFDAEFVGGDSTEHRFAGRQFDVVLCEPVVRRVSGRDDDENPRARGVVADDPERFLDVIERVLSPEGVAIYVVPATFLDRPATLRFRRQIVERGILEAVVLLPRVVPNQQQAALVLRQRRLVRPDEVLLIEDLRGTSHDFLVSVVSKWTSGPESRLPGRAASVAVETLLARSTNLSPRRWLRSPSASKPAVDRVGQLQDDLHAARARMRSLAALPDLRLRPRAVANLTTLGDLIDAGAAVRVERQRIRLDASHPTVRIRDVGSWRALRISEATSTMAAESTMNVGGYVALLPNDLLVLARGSRPVASVWTGRSGAVVSATVEVYRFAEQAAVSPEFVAAIINAPAASRFVSLGDVGRFDTREVEIPLIEVAQQRVVIDEVVQVLATLESLEVAERAVRRLADDYLDSIAAGDVAPRLGGQPGE